MTKTKAEDSGHDSGQSSMNTGDDFSDRNLVLIFSQRNATLHTFLFLFDVFFSGCESFSESSG